MNFLRRRSGACATGRTGTLEDLERLVRRVLALPIAAPLLILTGLGLGELATRVLALPEGTPVRVARQPDVPRIQIEALSRDMESIWRDGKRTADYVVFYRDHVEPVEQTLQRRGVPRSTAKRVAWPLVEEAQRRGLDPATVVSVLWVESRAKPSATSPVGAKGLMQVMPTHAGRWRGCGRNLYDIEDNLCNGTSILAWYLRRFPGDERRALLAYNGCVRGTNTPNCFRYPEKVQRLRHQIRGEIRAVRAPGADAASP